MSTRKVFTDHVYFTEGYCHTLALWFHEHMGYELRLLSGSSEGDHALVFRARLKWNV